MKITIIDSGAGNLKSIYNFFNRNFKSTLRVEKSPSLFIDNSDILVLPGVGHFGHVANHIRKTKLDESIQNFASNNKPLLGICLGAQLLTKSSEESPGTEGLGLIDAHCISLSKHPKYNGNIPRVGWSEIKSVNKQSFYFVHSYYMDSNKDNLEITYCVDEVTAMINFQKISAMQFHPEKSDLCGKEIVSKFIEKNV